MSQLYKGKVHFVKVCGKGLPPHLTGHPCQMKLGIIIPRDRYKIVTNICGFSSKHCNYPKFLWFILLFHINIAIGWTIPDSWTT
jgi:hypothetical protein